MPLLFKMTTPQQSSWCVLQWVKKESATAVQRAFHSQCWWTWHVQPLVISPLAGTYDIHISSQVGTRSAYFIFHVSTYITFLIW